MTPERWRQIEDLYHAAQDRTRAGRAVLLEHTDPEIRARVERMLALDSSGQILDQPAGGLMADPTKTVIASGTLPMHAYIKPSVHANLFRIPLR